LAITDVGLLQKFREDDKLFVNDQYSFRIYLLIYLNHAKEWSNIIIIIVVVVVLFPRQITAISTDLYNSSKTARNKLKLILSLESTQLFVKTYDAAANQLHNLVASTFHFLNYEKTPQLANTFNLYRVPYL